MAGNPDEESKFQVENPEEGNLTAFPGQRIKPRETTLRQFIESISSIPKEFLDAPVKFEIGVDGVSGLVGIEMTVGTKKMLLAEVRDAVEVINFITNVLMEEVKNGA